MPATLHTDAIYQLADDRHGYFTTAEAEAAGISAKALSKMADRGTVERISHGVYRLTRYPLFKHAQYVEAVLWPQGVIGVLSHVSALAFHGLSDVSPPRVHITVPSKHRVRRTPPQYLIVHRALLGADDVEIVDRIPVTTPARTIRDSHAAHVGPALIRQAIEEGRATGRLRKAEVDILIQELLGKSGSQ